MNELWGWLHEQTRRGELKFVWVCCGDWDAKTQIPRQCAISGLSLHNSFDEWINVKTWFNAFTRMEARGMAPMLQYIGLSLDGQHHLGMDDVNNLARICAWLLLRGAPLVVTKRVDCATSDEQE